MISIQNTASSAPPARYLIAQYTDDLIRKEPKNVGVVVEKGGYVAAQFIGETDDGNWDLRKLKWLSNPNPYRLWVDHWRKNMESFGSAWPSGPIVLSGDSFALISGGELMESGAATPQSVCRYLYAMLVSAGLSEAIETAAPDDSQVALASDIASTFRSNNLSDSLFARNPVLSNQHIKGTHSWFTVSFMQRVRDEVFVMEPVDFSTIKKNLARDHAAYVRYLFGDLLNRNIPDAPRVNNIALVRLQPADANHPAVEKGLEMLDNRICRVVNWWLPNERDGFVSERAAVANYL